MLKQAFEAGLSPEQFYNSTLGEVLLLIEAYQRRDNNEWQRTRLVAYTIYCSTAESKNRVSVWEFHPLPGDPTPKEVERIKAKEMARHGRELMREHAKVLEQFRKKNLLKID